METGDRIDDGARVPLAPVNDDTVRYMVWEAGIGKLRQLEQDWRLLAEQYRLMSDMDRMDESYRTAAWFGSLSDVADGMRLRPAAPTAPPAG